jgi:hypothetical protein
MKRKKKTLSTKERVRRHRARMRKAGYKYGWVKAPPKHDRPPKRGRLPKRSQEIRGSF